MAIRALLDVTDDSAHTVTTCPCSILGMLWDA